MPVGEVGEPGPDLSDVFGTVRVSQEDVELTTGVGGCVSVGTVGNGNGDGCVDDGDIVLVIRVQLLDELLEIRRAVTFRVRDEIAVNL